MESQGKSTIMPCAACKQLRRRCTESCVFLPYFPPTEPEKFAAVHRIFGASNVSKMLQELPLTEREDAVSSLVYEASARLREPVYGCVALIASLQKRVFQLQSELDEVSATTMRLRTQLASAVSLIVSSSQSPPSACAADESSYEQNKQLQQCEYGYSYPQMAEYYTEL